MPAILALILTVASTVLFQMGRGPAPLPDGVTDEDGPVLFRTSDRCIACHQGVTTPAGEDVSIGFDWRASMMANSARDPYWQAAVRREVLDNPGAREAIEDKCSRCHMPMANAQARVAGVGGQVFANLPRGAGASPAAALAADGVSCSTCHQIQAQGLGQESSFTGGFVIDPATPWGQRTVFGPFAVEESLASVMQSSSGFRPTQGSHIQSSELCASCHTLYTHALDEQGNEVGQLPEQMPFLEWRHSAYRNEQSCQSCHMPEVEDDVPVTGVLGGPRPNVSRHVFRGGNFFMQRMLNRYRADLGVQALPQELDRAAARTLEHLRTSAAGVSVDLVEVMEGRLTADVTVRNLAGHKLPTAYPSRRAWLHVTVHDSEGRVVFESGAFLPDGSVGGNDNDEDGSRFEPHYARIDRPDQVQIYEAIMGDAGGAVTTALLRGVRYLKDNRVLPRGFDPATAEDDIAVRGNALGDTDFAGGRDRVRYSVALGAAPGPYTFEVELWFQPIGFRWAENLKDYDAPETNRFTTYYESMASASATVVARDQATTR